METYDEPNYGYENPYGGNYERVDMIGTTIAHNLNANLTNIIDDVKKQRMDIIRLNNELKNSRYMVDKKNYDDIRSR